MQVKWIEQINRKDFKVTDITENSRVCEKHFMADNFVEDDFFSTILYEVSKMPLLKLNGCSLFSCN